MRNSKHKADKATDEVISDRKKFSKKGKIVLITAIVLCAIIIGSIVGIGIKNNASLLDKSYNLKVFSVSEMLITLSDDFKAEKKDGFTACFNNRNIEIETLKESFSSKKGLEDYTMQEYADIFIKNNENDLKSLKQKDDLAYFEYSDSNRYYITALYKTNEAFWTVTFSCKDKYQKEYNKTFIDLAKEIKFTN